MNRRRILHAAHQLFVQYGYTATTIRAIAQTAGLSQESVYKAFGGKAGLLKAVYDVTIAGDEEPVPVAERPQAIAVREAETPSEASRAWAAMVIELGVRIAPLLQVLAAARDSDDDIAALLSTLAEQRMRGARLVVEHWQSRGWLRSEVSVDEHATTLWTLNAPETRSLLDRCGWDDERYRSWLDRILRSTVLISAAVSDPSAEVRDPSAKVRDPSAAVSDPSAAVRDPSAAVSDPSAEVRDPSAAVSDPSAEVSDPSAAVSDPSAEP